MKNFKQFKAEIFAVIDKKYKEYFYFAQSKSAYYAEYRPKYPENCPADFLISYDFIEGHITISADTANVPIVKEYESFEKLLEELKNMVIREDKDEKEFKGIK